MSTRELTLTKPCPQCGASASERIIARTDTTRLRVSTSLVCATGCRSEGDAWELSDDLRDAFCATEGRWAARIDDLGERRLDALSAIKTLCGLTPIESIQAMRSSEPIAIGARIEVELVQEQLVATGASVTLTKVG